MAASTPVTPNWANLPDDTLLTVFERLGSVDVLLGVCRSWLRVATGEPRLWRCVDLADCCFDPTTDMEAMARAAVDRAAGCLEHFAADRFATSKLLRYIAKRTNCLKSLHLLTCMDFWYNDLVILGKRNPNLEELELTGCLPLFANRLHNNVLYDILDKCPHLESLDIHQCFNIEVDAALKAKCSRLKGVKFPKDSTKDYEYETFVESTMPGSLTFQIDPPPPLPNYEYPSSDEDGECDDEDCEDDVEDNERMMRIVRVMTITWNLLLVAL
uniref:F-box domain-containing protein n=1 Tax=Setaria italica TaxID=4555 RepID=K3YZG0_SETIT